MPSSPTRFRDAFLNSTGIVAERFEVHLFLRSVPPLRRPVARLLLLLRPSVFERDFATLREVALATSADEVRQTVVDLRGGPLYRSSMIRDHLGIRASGRRLVNMARRILKGSGAT
ncbi:MAG: hypothetical protein JNL10_05850 [Verrucomicrobiales bacterium]|nr:hypothetical protein [Verrucomicrobiales bacterium]